jgi:lipopolysaccharide transport system permease protein
LKDVEAQNEIAEGANTPAVQEMAFGISGEAAGAIDLAKLRMNSRPSHVPEESWTTIIDSRRTVFRFPWKELWNYRDLIYLFFYRDFSSTYKQTILGPLWYWVQPFLQTLVLTMVFSGIAKIPTHGIPPFLFNLSGMACWTFFADCLNKTSTTFATNAPLFGKIYFPRLASPIATIGMCMVNFFMVFSLFLLMYVIFMLHGAHIRPDWRLVALPVLILQMALIGMGVGFVVTALTTRYKDLAVMVGFGTQLWMYGSCVFYPLSEIPARYRPLMALNPMVTIIESFRYAFFGVGTAFLWQLITSFIVTVVIFVVGVVLFNKVERTFTDTI